MTGEGSSVGRRGFLAGAGTATALGLAGCTGTFGGGGEADTLRVGTYSAYVDAPSTSAGAWVKEEFESRYDETLEWVVKENELNYFIQRSNADLDLEADVYLGVTPQDLVRVRNSVENGPLFEPWNVDEVANAGNLKEQFRFDSKNRVVPTGASYVSLVYDERRVDPPATLEALTREEYRGKLLLANPQSTATGLLFLLWTIEVKGPDGYLDYWRRLLDNDVRILGSWSASYDAYLNEEAPMVVSYSTDQVYAANADQNMARHQIGFPNDQGYVYVDGAAKFAGTNRSALARKFLDFMLDPEVARKTAVKNVGIPTVTNASLPEDVRQYAHVPEHPLQHDSETLTEHMNDWREEWAQTVASK